jgi:aminopeptidase-like protein
MYRIVFIPETIGSITYLSRNYKEMREKTIAGFNVSCVGDDRAYSYLPSRNGKTLSDDIAKHVLSHTDSNYKSYTWLDRGSDERQYCAPGIDLPIASIMRTKYGQYPEYHTSLDDLDNVVTPTGLDGGYWSIRKAIEAIEKNKKYLVTVLGEPQMGKRGLYPTLSTKKSGEEVRLMMDLISLCDGKNTLLQIAETLNTPIWELYELVDKLVTHKLLQENE